MLFHWPHRAGGLTEDDERMAAAALGASHPFVRAICRTRIAARQALTSSTTAPAAAATALLDLFAGPLLLVVSAAVSLTFLGLWWRARRTLLDRTQELIADGNGPAGLPVIAREGRRLLSRRERERLARRLEETLEDSWKWERTPPPSRPLYGIQCLRDSATEVSAIVRTLRTRRVRAQGVALVARLLGDGERSPLYAGDSRRLQEEVCRIRYLLEAGPSRPGGTRLQSSVDS